MKKHAYLVLAHGDVTGLIRLIKACDDQRNDIYIHYDKKFVLDEEKLNTVNQAATKSRIFWVDRISVNWGGYSIIEAQLIMLREAVKNNYSYYHLVSGVDYPIKSQDYIHYFFEEHEGEEFIEFWDRDDYYYRVKYYYPYQERIGTYTYDIKTLTLRVLAKLNVFGQKLRRINRLKMFDVEWKIGSNWCSFSHSFAEYLLGKEEEIYEMFKEGVAVDELYLQTILWNSNFRDKNSSVRSRLIDWNRGNPYVWKLSDLDELMDSEAMFARKIIDDDLIDAINKRFGE